MSGYLTILTIFALIICSIILYRIFRNKDFREILKYSLAGIFFAIIDFIIEYLGTSTGKWTYFESIFFIFGLVPIELLILFFSSGVILRFIFLNLNKIKIPVKTDAIFYILMIFTSILYLREIYQYTESSLLPLALVFGMWGLLHISKDNREGVLILAILITILDYFVEIWIVSSGSYKYITGFSIHIPLIYGLLSLGFLAIMEKMHKLDRFLDSLIIRNLLRMFGVYRERYKNKINRAKRKMKEVYNKRSNF